MVTQENQRKPNVWHTIRNQLIVAAFFLPLMFIAKLVADWRNAGPLERAGWLLLFVNGAGIPLIIFLYMKIRNQRRPERFVADESSTNLERPSQRTADQDPSG
jgi:hypothetical protein